MGRKKEEGGTPPGPNVLSAGARSEKEKKRETWGGGDATDAGWAMRMQMHGGGLLGKKGG